MSAYDAQAAYHAMDRCRATLPAARDAQAAGSPERQALDDLIAQHQRVEALLFANVAPFPTRRHA